jgi:hypothetical protein
VASYQPGTTVTLTGLAAPDSIFAGWGGACSGTGTCTVLMSQHLLVSAEFLGPRLLTVNLTSTDDGGGIVSIQPFGPPCAVGPGFPAPPCVASYQPGTTGDADGFGRAGFDLRRLGRRVLGDRDLHGADVAAPARVGDVYAPGRYHAGLGPTCPSRRRTRTAPRRSR